MRPGLTCLAAVEGRNTLRRSQMIDADQRYASRVTLRADLAHPAPHGERSSSSARGYHAVDESEEYVEDVAADEVAG